MLLALALAVPLRLATLDQETIQQEVERYLSDALGLEVRGGEVRISLGWRAWVGADDLRVANLPGRTSPHLLEAERLDLSLRIWPLMRGRVDVGGLALRGATLRIEPAVAPDTPAPVPDWDALEEGREGEAVHVAVRRVRAEDLVILVGPPDEARRIAFDELYLEASGAHENRAAHMRGDVDGEPFELAGLVGPSSALTDPARPFPVHRPPGAVDEPDFGLTEFNLAA